MKARRWSEIPLLHVNKVFARLPAEFAFPEKLHEGCDSPPWKVDQVARFEEREKSTKKKQQPAALTLSECLASSSDVSGKL